MRRQQSLLTPYGVFFFALLLLLSLPRASTENARGLTVAMMAPAWGVASSVKALLVLPFSWMETSGNTTEKKEKLQDLELENVTLKTEVAQLQELFRHELDLLSHMTALSTYKQHQKEFESLMTKEMTALPAQVIFRSPSSWNSSLWIDLGEDHNTLNSPLVITKNSPVIVGSSLIGLVDYVGQRQSRVRLLTDSGLSCSVRVARGTPSRLKLIADIQSLISALTVQQEVAIDTKDKQQLFSLLEKLRHTLSGNDDAWYLAKGEISGSSAPLWRGPGQLLKGIGFNYDFDDDEGPARDLRSGKPLNASSTIPTLPLIREGDLLVTTGLDGVFPPGLHVGYVTRLFPLNEGDYYYELEARPAAGTLSDLTHVYVIPRERTTSDMIP